MVGAISIETMNALHGTNVRLPKMRELAVA
jgi:hypothetical protein